MFVEENVSQEELPPSRVNHTGIKITPQLRQEHGKRVAAAKAEAV
jgi:hypothetical protein